MHKPRLVQRRAAGSNLHASGSVATVEAPRGEDASQPYVVVHVPWFYTHVVASYLRPGLESRPSVGTLSAELAACFPAPCSEEQAVALLLHLGLGVGVPPPKGSSHVARVLLPGRLAPARPDPVWHPEPRRFPRCGGQRFCPDRGAQATALSCGRPACVAWGLVPQLQAALLGEEGGGWRVSLLWAAGATLSLGDGDVEAVVEAVPGGGGLDVALRLGGGAALLDRARGHAERLTALVRAVWGAVEGVPPAREVLSVRDVERGCLPRASYPLAEVVGEWVLHPLGFSERVSDLLALTGAAAEPPSPGSPPGPIAQRARPSLREVAKRLRTVARVVQHIQGTTEASLGLHVGAAQSAVSDSDSD